MVTALIYTRFATDIHHTLTRTYHKKCRLHRLWEPRHATLFLASMTLSTPSAKMRGAVGGAAYLTRNGESFCGVGVLDDKPDALNGVHGLCKLVGQVNEAPRGRGTGHVEHTSMSAE